MHPRDEHALGMAAQFVSDVGYLGVQMQGDNEPATHEFWVSLQSLLEQKGDMVQVAIRHSSPLSLASSGLAEVTVQNVAGLYRAHAAQLTL